MSQPRFSKKTYVLVAEAIREAENTKYAVALKLSEKFEADNSRFDFKRFSKACGITL